MFSLLDLCFVLCSLLTNLQSGSPFPSEKFEAEARFFFAEGEREGRGRGTWSQVNSWHTTCTKDHGLFISITHKSIRSENLITQLGYTKKIHLKCCSLITLAPVSLKFEPVGRWYEAHINRRHHTLSSYHSVGSGSSDSLSSSDESLDSEEEDDSFLLTLDPKEWKVEYN